MPARAAKRWPGGLIGSLLLHGLPLLALLGWRPTPAETPAPVPVQLVIEQPPPIPPPSPAEPPTSEPQPHGRLASADMAQVTTPQPEQGAADAPKPPEPEPPPPAKAQSAAEPAAPPEPEPEAPAQPPPAALPEPAPIPAEAETKLAMALPRPPKPVPHRREPAPMSLPMASAWPLPLRETRIREPTSPTPRFASLTGPAAVRDEYCVRALALTLRHLDLVPLSFLAGRRGKTVVTIRILGDGTVNSVTLVESSGFPDIDQRIEKMVFAVGQYPPLPPRLPGPWTDFTFSMVFPDPAQR